MYLDFVSLMSYKIKRLELKEFDVTCSAMAIVEVVLVRSHMPHVRRMILNLYLVRRYTWIFLFHSRGLLHRKACVLLSSCPPCSAEVYLFRTDQFMQILSLQRDSPSLQIKHFFFTDNML